jgi:hypothetical protein
MENFVIPKDATLYEVYKSGIITWLMRRGVIPVPNAVHFRYYEIYQAYISQGINKTKAVKLTADESGVTEKTIWKVLRMMSN